MVERDRKITYQVYATVLFFIILTILAGMSVL